MANLPSSTPSPSSSNVSTPSMGIQRTITLMSDPSFLSNKSDYASNMFIVVGNSSHLPISATGSLSLAQNPSLKFPHTLLVPSIKKNLLSISQLTNDNDVFVELDHSCFMNDTYSNKVLLRGVLETGCTTFHLHLVQHLPLH
ncbi:hypothetical protein Scep_027340 [Stephania cephalantha]|uniref:Uncharacterized protein n=1 Tax=Stephania cephalantha TaxID=152367 RepID=A0AAP0HH62_9MAGN